VPQLTPTHAPPFLLKPPPPPPPPRRRPQNSWQFAPNLSLFSFFLLSSPAGVSVTLDSFSRDAMHAGNVFFKLASSDLRPF